MKKKGLKWAAVILAAAMMTTACSSGSGSGEADSAVQETAAAGAGTTQEAAGAGTNQETAAGAGEAVSYKEELNIAVAQQAPSLDLHKNASLIARQMMDGTCWEKLVTLNSNAEAVPELCESYEVSEDAKTIVFKLRKGVLFHDGSEMTADDVVASMNRWIEGYSVAGNMVGDARFEKIDEETVRISADVPILLFPVVIAGSAQPASITTAEACGNEDTNGFMVDYIGTGPYKFVEWVQDQYIRLERFEDYVPYGTEGEEMDGWAGYKAAPTKTITFHIVPESTTRNAGLETGQYDVVYNLPSDDVERVSSVEGITVFRTQQGSVAPIFNKKQGIASNQWFRQAVNTCLDYDEVLTAMYGEGGYELGSCYMDSAQAFWYTDAGSEYYYQNDPEKAKQILEENGYNGETFHLMAATLNKMDYMAVAIESQLEEIGIPVELTIVDWATLESYSLDPSMFDMYIVTFSQVPLPSMKLYLGPTFRGWSEDETLQAYMAEMNGATSMDEAKAAWEKVQAYSWEYLPIINLGHYIANYAWNDNVEGLNTYSGLYFWNAGVRE